MNDKYLNLVNSGVVKQLAKKLGLPQPVPLRRQGFEPERIPLSGIVVVPGGGEDANAIATTLLDWGLDVRRTAPTTPASIQAIVQGFTDLDDPSHTSEITIATGAMMRSLAPHGRIVSISRQPQPGDSPEFAATQGGVRGFLRSLGKELRAGATANGIVIDGPVGIHAPSVVGALGFFLSVNSAFIDGQFLTVTSRAGHAPADPDRPLAGQVAVVTGAARGIGAAIARVLARDGAGVIGVDVPAAGEALARVMNRVGGTALHLDITQPDAAHQLLELARKRFGRLDMVVHNAGVLRDKSLANMTAEQWNTVIRVNLAAQLQLNETLLAAADIAPDGLRLVSLASTSGIAGNRGQTNYSYSKAGVIAMTEAIAPTIADSGGTANAVAPGFIETDMTATMPPVARQVARRVSSLQQGGQPLDVAEAIAFLVSPQATGINGQTLRVCGQNLVGR